MAAIAPPSGGGGGYDYQFVKIPSDMFICTVCFLPSKQPYLSECCGYTFCKSCLEGCKKFSNICPMCRSEYFKAIFNKQADRVIRSLHVFCTNKIQGCEWQGEVNNISNHLGNCLFQIVHCPNDCGESLQWQYLTIHVETECPCRRINCQYCNDVGEYQFIEGQHKEECPKFPIECPNKCEIKSICRDEVEEHRGICPLEMIQCDYHAVGCRVKIARKDIKTHKQETMEEHLSLSINELMETKRQLEKTNHEVEKTKDDFTQQLVWHTTKIANVEQQLTTSQQEVKKTKEGLVFVKSGYSSTNKQPTTVEQSSNNAVTQLKQQLSASQQETRKTREDLTKQLIQTEKNLTAKLTASQQETRKTREDLTKQLTQTEKNLTAKLTASQQEAKQTKDQLLQKLTATEKELNTTKQKLATTCHNLTKAEKEHTTLAASTDKALTEMENKFQAKITAAENRIVKLEKKLQKNTQSIEEDSWLTSLHDRASKLSSGDQVVPVVVKMTEFTKHKDAEWLSNSFYDDHNKTCELQLSIVVNRNDPTFMSVYLIKDEQSRRPADRFAVKLLNQISNQKHCQGQSDGSWYLPIINTIWQKKFFISYKDLHKSTAEYQYLRDDTLFFEVKDSPHAIMAAIAPPSGGGGGYDYQFVKTPSDMLICTVCFLPSKQPYLSECCGHTFCKSCLEGSKKFSNICPMCRSEDFKAIFNKQADRVIRSLHVFCTNNEQGCEWQGEVNDITNHLGNCLFQIVHCPNDCEELFQRQYLTIHVEIECPRRKVNCQYYNDVGEYQFIEAQHKEECPKFPIQCPNKCDIERICRDEIEKHREICPLEMIQCDYHVIGCKVKMTRKDINTHKQEAMEEHLSLSINELMETRRQLKSAQCEVEKTKDDFTQQLVWHTTKVANVEGQLTTSQQEAKKTKEGLIQRMVLVENDYSATNKQLTTVEQSSNNALAQLKQQLSASQQEAKRTKDQLLQKLTATEKELNTTKQQLATTCHNLTKAEKEHTTLAASTDKALTEMENKFQAKMAEIANVAENKITRLEAKLQQKTEQLQEKILDPWFTSIQHRASKLSSGDQVVPVIVKMTEFTKHKDAEWLSNSFYDNYNKTCKFQLKVVVNRNDPTFMSVYLIKDLQSKQPVDMFTVKLLNQIRDRKHHRGQSDIGWFIPIPGNTIWQKKSFISYKDLHKSTAEYQYLKNDTLFFEVRKV